MSEKREFRQTRFERPAGATEIVLVRHGESRAATDDNPFPLVDGHGDPELHVDGRAQAERVGERLKNHAFDAIYATNLRRTTETAAPLCAHLRMEPIIEPDLREVFLGEWEGGVMRRYVAEGHPTYARVLAEERWDVIPGAEPREVFHSRLNTAVQRIHQRHPDQIVAAFVHGGVIGALLANAVGASGFAFNGADNGSISHIVVLGDQMQVRRFNDTSHLYDAIHSGAGAMT